MRRVVWKRGAEMSLLTLMTADTGQRTPPNRVVKLLRSTTAAIICALYMNSGMNAVSSVLKTYDDYMFQFNSISGL